jgi:O-antigen ligase
MQSDCTGNKVPVSANGEAGMAVNTVSPLDRIGLAGIALLVSIPFLVWHHYYPISSFYSEWTALLCGMIVAVSLAALRRGDVIMLPWLSVGFLGLVLVLGAQIMLGTVTHPERSYVAMLNAAWVALLVAAVANLRSRMKGDTAVVVAQMALASGGFLVVVTGFLQYFQLDIFGVHLVEHDKVSSYMIGVVGQTNYFANFVACALVSLVYLVSQRRAGFFIAAIVGIPMLIALTLSGTRSAWVFAALMPACAVLCHRGSRDRDTWRLLVACVATFAMVVAIQVLNASFGIFEGEREAGTPGVVRLLDSVARGGGEGELVRGRLAYYAWLQFLSAPLTGVGFGQYAWHVFEISARSDLVLGPGIDRHAHNFLLQLMAETGILGAGCVLLPLVAWFIRIPYARPTIVQSWILTIALIQLAQAMIELPHWYAHFLGLFALVLGLGATGGLALPVNAIRKTVVVVALVTGIAALGSALKDYRDLETWYLDVEAGEKAGKAVSGEQLDRLRALHRASIYAPLMELLAAELILVNKQDLDEKLALIDRAMRVYPSPGAAKRQVVLLALAGRPEEAWRTLRAMSVVYRSKMPAILADLEAYERIHPASLGDMLARARAELVREP